MMKKVEVVGWIMIIRQSRFMPLDDAQISFNLQLQLALPLDSVTYILILQLLGNCIKMELDENAVETFLTKFKASGQSRKSNVEHQLTFIDNDKRVDQVQMFGLQLEDTTIASRSLYNDQS